MSGLIQITPPTTDPITLDELKTQAHIDTTAEDSLLTSMIAAATSACEIDSQRSFLTQTWQYVLPSFHPHHRYQYQPVYGYDGYSFWYGTPRCHIIRLPRPPLQSVTSVVYSDINGNPVTMTEGTDYWVDTYGTFGSIRLKQQYQTEVGNPSAVVITYVAGYGDTAASVPAPALHAVRLLSAYLTQNRETAAGLHVYQLPFGVKELLNTIRVVQI